MGYVVLGGISVIAWGASGLLPDVTTDEGERERVLGAVAEQ